ncbi:inosine-uridine preferring nucleoside hydrolase-domain-containing protein [Lasiosphaeria miniovina]|uniref:Inosine-uridine preferring nucleoside hydrolase-domain-containing protein n=1 Tax=Lasiosphaeria miniovina TaxID=1954250 RepID=A0AA40EDH3_9PEZI|nr:inosine-uridine preferring nucleoside hydrolase-domain-containing protein [Lasiosphaeria miniovina]KAK0733416.1 inosine-uridine preferring nucleoside hydrolase-domain-containing protein [Lasiosphaeria miniovina]
MADAPIPVWLDCDPGHDTCLVWTTGGPDHLPLFPLTAPGPIAQASLPPSVPSRPASLPAPSSPPCPIQSAPCTDAGQGRQTSPGARVTPSRCRPRISTSDAFAILLAAYHPTIRFLGVSTVFGNASLEKTTRNASSILTAIGKAREVPVFVGASHALARPPMHAPTDIHGESGLDGTDLLPQPLVAPNREVPAVDAAAAALRAEAPGTAWVVATGSFTNVAALFMQHPDLVGHIKGLSLMGGALGGGFTPAVMGHVDGMPRIGNWTQFAEFNVLADPEAAAAIFNNKALAAKTTLVTLDLSHQVLTTREVRDLILYGPGHGPGHAHDGQPKTGPGKTTLRTMLVELLMFFAKTYSDVFGITEGPPLHDPLAVAAILTEIGTDNNNKEDAIPFYDFDPLKTTASASSPPAERFDVAVVTEGTYEDAHAGARTGQITTTLLPPGAQGVRIPRGLDIPRFWKVLEECVSRADAANAVAAAAAAAAVAAAGA